MKLNIKVTDDKLEKEGAWVVWQMDDSIRVKLTRSTIPTIQKHLQTLLKQNRKALRNEDAQKEVMIKFLSRYVILDWEGIKDDGEEFPYSVENAVIILEAIDDFYNWVMNESQNILNFAEYDEDDTTVEERGEELKK